MANRVWVAPKNLCPQCKYPLNADPGHSPNSSLILSLDGGGIRGYSTLLILSDLMKEVQKVEKNYRDFHQCPDDGDCQTCNDLFKPCTYFDYIVGTSTGGLIAIMLGRLRMGVDDCIRQYKNLGGEIFGKPRHFHARTGFFFWDRPKFNTDTLKKIIDEVMVQKRRQEDISADGSGTWDKFAQPEKQGRYADCKTAVVAVREDERGSNTFLFRSYPHPKPEGSHEEQVPSPLNPGPASTHLITQIAAATSAAPGYFDPVKLGRGGDTATYVDGAIKGNNPPSIAWQEAYHMARLHESSIPASRAIAGLVSIGTGKSVWNFLGDNRSITLMKYLHMLRAQSKIITDTEPVHEDVYVWTGSHGNPYYRFNVQDGLEKTKLDEWRNTENRSEGRKVKLSTLEYLQLVTEQYLNGEEYAIRQLGPKRSVRENLITCAEMLVTYRRARESSQQQESLHNTPDDESSFQDC